MKNSKHEARKERVFEKALTFVYEIMTYIQQAMTKHQNIH
jgi:hypothetical protein